MIGADSPRFFKDAGPFIVHPGGALESRLEFQSGSITPNRLFYVLHNGERAVDVDASTWRLRVEGDAVERPLTVTYEDIRGMPRRSLTCYLECAGNHRAMFHRLGGRRAGSPPWGTGAVGNAEWTGVPLAHVLGEAKIADSAVSVLREGLDTTAPEGGVATVGNYPLGVSPSSIASRNLCIPDDGLSRGNSVPFRLWRSSSARARRAALHGAVRTHETEVRGHGGDRGVLRLQSDQIPQGLSALLFELHQ